jgi:hypothetical protein
LEIDSYDQIECVDVVVVVFSLSLKPLFSFFSYKVGIAVNQVADVLRKKKENVRALEMYMKAGEERETIVLMCNRLLL